MNTTSGWVLFSLFILTMIFIDLGVFNRQSKEISIRKALWWTGFWVMLAFAFNVLVYYNEGQEKASEFFTGFLIEKSLSVDNIFVIILIFTYFKVPSAYQHKVLFWGILGALVMRFVFIVTGIELINRFHWLIYIFGGFLVLTGIRMIRHSDESFEPSKNPVVRFIVYTSNVFAILGLRSLYFALAGMHQYFAYLKYGLAAILIFVGIKMCISDFYKVPIEISLAFIVLTLSVAVLASLALLQRNVKSPVTE